MMGTPAYMPPEQALGDVDRIDQRSDVFALGAILCEVLTGEPPYREQDGDLVRQAASAALDGAHARLKTSGADESLVTLCIECLSPAQRARPESAAEVAERVGGYLTSVEERARQAELDAASARYKHRTTRIVAAATLVVLALGAGSWGWLDWQERSRRIEATQLVASSRSVTSGAHGKALASDLDRHLWEAAVASAEQLVALAESDHVEAMEREHAHAMLAEIQEGRRLAEAELACRERDEAMLARLEELRVPLDDDVRNAGWQAKESRRLDAAYAKAFADYLGGASLLDQPLEEALVALQEGAIAEELATNLDHWALVRRRLHAPGEDLDAPSTRLRELASRLDGGDPWRSRLRELLADARHEADALLELADSVEPTSITAAGHRVLGEALCQAGASEAAVDAMLRAQELFPRDFSLCVDLALHLELLGEVRWEEALTMYRIAQALRPERVDVLHRQGVLLDRLQRHADAERIFRHVLEKKETPHVLCHLGWAAASLGQAEEAQSAFERALELDPGWSDAHRMAGAAHLERGEVEEAIAAYRRAAELSPRNPVHHYNLGTTLMNAGHLEEAITWLQGAIQLHPGYAEAHANLGLALAASRRHGEAIQAYAHALEVNPGMSRVQFNKGNSHVELDQLDEAAGCYDKAVQMDPGNAGYWVNLAITRGELGDIERSLECYQEAIRLEPENAITYHNLAVTLEEGGRLEAAAEWYEKALAVDPLLGRSQRRLARLRQRPFLENILTGVAQASSSEQWQNAVLLGHELERLPEVVALTERTLATSPELIEADPRGLYNSACAAARLACDSAAERSVEEQERARRLALDWLRREVERWEGSLREGGSNAAAARQSIEMALHDADLAGFQRERLASLSSAEQAAWQDLWNTLEQALREEGR